MCVCEDGSFSWEILFVGRDCRNNICIPQLPIADQRKLSYRLNSVRGTSGINSLLLADGRAISCFGGGNVSSKADHQQVVNGVGTRENSFVDYMMVVNVKISGIKNCPHSVLREEKRKGMRKHDASNKIGIGTWNVLTLLRASYGVRLTSKTLRKKDERS